MNASLYRQNLPPRSYTCYPEIAGGYASSYRGECTTSPLVFASVTIHLGAWEAHCPEEYLSAEILHHIAHDSQFAGVVRRLEARAFEHHLDCEFFENCGYVMSEPGPLLPAIDVLSNLRSIAWYGICPVPSPEIIIRLAKACPLLHSIALP
ncbi:uncharacterized protein C8Q71DRAFT_388714 [Rhodofomes roseus]|uniref:Uncharacterized protein n=1 Tax=Rhodofomes roseus TaxID=34475 RepID=A0ABQ8JZK4_9APHY|nr:uncharacterized protein C8Q71DRAFT_388714 [Rhodofomes roseus]KAH9829812.1 hypothetical protein C8Q71DRAFT_388714 [Rhodofomes roseus]